jgi:predicted sugar kinase
LFIKSPARLHFGLIEICPGEPSLFAGCGMTIDEPSTQMTLEFETTEANDRSDWQVECSVAWKDRIERTLTLAGYQLPNSSCRFTLRLVQPPMPHAGLGSGTQLACCVATLVAVARSGDPFDGTAFEAESVDANRFWTDADATDDSRAVDRLADATGRGARSYVGLASHLWGGFIVDHGIPSEQNHRRSVDRVSLPETWRVLLVRPASSSTVSGKVETDYFRRCAIPNPNRHRMLAMIVDDLVPAIKTQNLNHFGEALYDYGCLGGELFRAVQGGIYRDAVVAELVDAIRGMGVDATGQTSWGPTVYAIVGDLDEARALEERLRDRWGTQITTIISRPTNQPSILGRLD